jgi:hypothetical protein
MVGLFPVLSSNGDLCSGFVVQDLWYMPNVANAVAFSWVVVPALADTRKKNSDDGGEFGGWLKKAYQPLPASQRARQVRVGAAAPPKMVARPSALLSGINYHLQKVAAQQATQHLYKRRIFLAAWLSSPPPLPSRRNLLLRPPDRPPNRFATNGEVGFKSGVDSDGSFFTVGWMLWDGLDTPFSL